MSEEIVVRDDEMADLGREIAVAVAELVLAALAELERTLTAELERLRG